jgi:hypothetical protein
MVRDRSLAITGFRSIYLGSAPRNAKGKRSETKIQIGCHRLKPATRIELRTTALRSKRTYNPTTDSISIYDEADIPQSQNLKSHRSNTMLRLRKRVRGFYLTTRLNEGIQQAYPGAFNIPDITRNQRQIPL